MGNTQSSPSLRSSRTLIGHDKSRSDFSDGRSRMSQAVSFYQTPPGSLDLRELERPASSPHSPARSRHSGISQPSPQLESSAKETQAQTLCIWRPGVYSLINAGSGTVLDLSGADDRSVIGFIAHHRPNQQWDFEALGEGYTIRSVSSGLYLTVEDGVTEGCVLISSPYPIAWKVKAANEGGELFVRIFWPNEKFAFELVDGTPGTKVQLAQYKTDQACQLWRVLEHESLQKRQSSSDSMSRGDGNQITVASVPTETLVISEDKDAITTTRTTTTTTTVTTVTKTPRSFMV